MIKVTIGESKPQEKPCPKLMTLKESKSIFLFLNERTCVCLGKGSVLNWEVGEYYDGTNISLFEDYNEPITIQNA
jgi:hypothetical protein